MLIMLKHQYKSKLLFVCTTFTSISCTKKCYVCYLYSLSANTEGGFENPLYSQAKEPVAEIGHIDITPEGEVEQTGDKTNLTYGSWMQQQK